MPGIGLGLHTALPSLEELSVQCRCAYSPASVEGESERLWHCQQLHTGTGVTLVSWAQRLAPNGDRARSKGEEVVLPGPKPCLPSRGAASSPGLRDICPASRPQTAAQSHVSTSTRESGNWLWP